MSSMTSRLARRLRKKNAVLKTARILQGVCPNDGVRLMRHVMSDIPDIKWKCPVCLSMFN